MNARQAAVIKLLRADLRRDLYESSKDGEVGDGMFYMTYPTESYAPLTQGDVNELLVDGIIRRKWADCDGCFLLTVKGRTE
jgi:hypothetical protein